MDTKQAIDIHTGIRRKKWTKRFAFIFFLILFLASFSLLETTLESAVSDIYYTNDNNPPPEVTSYTETYSGPGTRYSVLYGREPLQCQIAKPNNVERTVSTQLVIDGSPSRSDRSTLKVKSQIFTDKTDPLLACLNGTQFTQDDRFMSRAVGITDLNYGDRPGGSSSFDTLSIIIPPGNDRASVVATAERQVLNTPLTIQILKNKEGVTQAGIATYSLSVSTSNFQIYRAEGSRISTQDQHHVEFPPTNPDNSVSMSLQPSEGAEQAAEKDNTEYPRDDDSRSVLIFPIAALSSWLGFLFSSRHSQSAVRRRVRRLFIWLSVTVIVIGSLTTLKIIDIDYDIASPLLLLTVPTILIFAIGSSFKLARRRFFMLLAAIVLALLISIIALTLAGATLTHVTTLASVAGCLVGATALSVVWPSVIKSWQDGVVFWIVSLLEAVMFALYPPSSSSTLMPACLIAWSTYMYIASRRINTSKRNSCIIALLTLFSLSPILLIFDDWSQLNLQVMAIASAITSPQQLAMIMLLMTDALLLAYLIRILWLLRTSAFSGDNALIKAAALGIMLIVSSVQVELISTYSAILSAASCYIGFSWLIRLDDNARRLSNVNRRIHARLLRLSSQRTKISTLAALHFRTQASRSDSDDIDISKMMQQQHRLDSAAGMFRAVRSRYVGLTQAAQGSSGGYSPAENACFGLSVAFAVSMPFMVFELLPFISSLRQDLDRYSPIEIVVTMLHYVRWIAMGGIFGYFYPAIRGRVPVRKAMALLLAVAPIELFGVDFAEPAAVFLPAIAIKTGFLLFFTLSLGLAWEWRLARAASVHWGRVRDFSRLKSFLVPVSTVIIAGVTALATSVASAAVNEMVQPTLPPKSQETTTFPAGQGK